jgi:hypothetical protein
MDPAQQASFMANASAAIQASNAAVAGAATGQGSAETTDSGPGTGSGTGGSTVGGGGAGSGTNASTSPSAAAAAELLQIFEVLKASIADGSMESKTGVTTLDLSAAVV